MKRVFISQTPKTEISREKSVNVYYAVYANNVSCYEEQDGFEETTGEPILNRKMSIVFEFKKIKEEDIEDITREEILKRHTQKAVLVSSSETYIIDLTEIPVPAINSADYANSEELQYWLNGYYLQYVLNENKDWQVENWIEKL